MSTVRSRLTSSFAAGLLTLLALGGLSACGEAETTQAGASSGSDASATEPEPTTDEDAETDGEDSDTDAAQADSSTGCLVGTWLADNARLGAIFKSAAAGTGAAGALSDPTGTVLVTFGPEGQYSVTYDAWTMAMEQDGMTMELIREGTDTGKYEATDAGHVEWSETKIGSVAIMKSPAGKYEIPGSPSDTSGTFACERDSLEITAAGSTTGLDRQ